MPLGVPMLFALLAGAAQAATFDIATFSAPPGWTADQRKNFISFLHVDREQGYFCQLALFDSVPSSGDLGRDFAAEWEVVVRGGFSAPAAPGSKAGRTQAGITYRQGEAQVRQQNNAMRAQLTVLSAGARVQSVLLVASGGEVAARCREPARAFLDGIRHGPEVAATQNPPAPKPAEAGAGNASAKGHAVVWMGLTQDAGSYAPKPRWLTLFTDGQAFEDLPYSGLAGFDRAASQRDPNQQGYWGIYTIERGAGAIRRPGVVNPTKLQAEGPDKMNVSGYTYHRSKAVDGLRLEGAWTSYANPDDPDLDRIPVGARPVIRFSRDGRFADEGIFATILQSYGSPGQDQAGSGNYEIRDFSLALRYSDGRVKQVAFTGLLGADPAVSTNIVFLARTRFNKRKN